VAVDGDVGNVVTLGNAPATYGVVSEETGVGPKPDSLHRCLAEARENLRLIEERKAQHVLGVDIPLQLIKEERRLRERIAGLERDRRGI
jgi:hypothetical protein